MGETFLLLCEPLKKVKNHLKYFILKHALKSY